MSLKIQDLPLEERPRERLVKYGVEHLSNEELLSIFLKSGTINYSVREISINILKMCGSMKNLKKITLPTLLSVPGIGIAKAFSLLSMLELGKRIYMEPDVEKHIRYKNAVDIYDSIKYLFYDKKQEYFYCLYFNSRQELIERKLLFMGTINRSIVHPREIFKEAYLCSASSIVCMHNHPSNDVNPSTEDIRLTKALIEIGKVNGIPIVDHIIVGEDRYYSFYEESEIFTR